MSAWGQTEKNSARADVFHFALELGNCSTRSACLKRAHKLKYLAARVAVDCYCLQYRFRNRSSMAATPLRIVSRHQVTCLQMFNLAVRNVDAKLLYLGGTHYAI